MNANVKTAIKILLSLLLLAFIAYSAGIDKTLEQLSSANLWFLPIGILVYLISQFVSSYRWQFLAQPLGFNCSIREFYDYYTSG